MAVIDIVMIHLRIVKPRADMIDNGVTTIWKFADCNMYVLTTDAQFNATLIPLFAYSAAQVK